MRYLCAVTLTVVALLVSGCGGAGGSTSGGDTTSGNGTSQGGGTNTGGGGNDGGDQRAAFNDCLKQNGVTPPSGRPTARPSERPTARLTARPTDRPSGGPGGFGSMSPEMQKAYEACRSLMPRGGNRPPNG
ncbi:PT domain-containing protein [Nonomuraea sp. M3C6]|uniref:PT domain-containing protein n=1 Tax=Nonomuraea marmarensis TaxID=3351344 RepID=A0ABW7ADE7_9ACTN